MVLIIKISKSIKISLVVFGMSFVCLNDIQAQNLPSIIPKPVAIEMTEGNFILDKQVSIHYNSKQNDLKPIAGFLASYVKNISGFLCSMNKPTNKKVEFIIKKGIQEEGYELSVSPSVISISASSDKGIFYGVQSLIQTLPAIRTNDKLQIPCMEIKDYPRFQWRGMMLDVSRHFFSPDLVKEFIDLLATYKMNVFHWHLVDGAGWRLEIKKYPKLTQQAAWRVDDSDKTWNWSEIQFNQDRNQSTYGGYYTQEQAKEIVEYAKARNIMVVPEIEMPGHSEAVMAAYPELSCNAQNHFGQSGNFFASKVESNYCAGNDNSFVFLQNVLTEVMKIFPSTYIHVGGDEVDKTSWKHCPKCQGRMKKENLKDENELQSYFMHRIEKFLVSQKRKMIGWDEILEGGLAPEATVMSWRGEKGGIEAAKMGHDVIMTPTTPCYFDYYQGDPETEPLAFGGGNTLKLVYDYEPIPEELSADEAKHILGSQANLWTEYISTYEHVEYMTLPRMLALSEVLWSPKEKRNWANFTQRLQPHLRSFEQRGIHYSKGNFKVDIQSVLVDNKHVVSLLSENSNAVIYYTLNGTEPSTTSFKYEKPFNISGTTTIKASMAVNDKIMTRKPAEQSFTSNKGIGQIINFSSTFSQYYPANGSSTLLDGIRGSKDISKQWLAFNGVDMIATIDLQKSTLIRSIALGAIQNWQQWIFLPQWVKFEISEDGINYKEITIVQNEVSLTEKNTHLKDFKAELTPQKAQYIRVTAKNLGKCPIGHPGENQASWLFVDEIMIE